MASNSIELNKEYKLNLNSSSPLMLLRYPFKPSSIDIHKSGTLEINSNTNEYNITLANNKNTTEKFKSHSHNVNKVNNNEYILLFDNNEFNLIKPCIDLHNIKHVQEREYNDDNIINTTVKSKKVKTNRERIAQSLYTGQKVKKPVVKSIKVKEKSMKSKKGTKEANDDNNDDNNDTNDDVSIDKIKDELKNDGWIVEKSDSNYIDSRCRNFFNCDYVDGTIIGYLSADNNNGLALWYFRHDDGDNEDLELHELTKCKEYYDNNVVDNPEISNKRKRVENIDDSDDDL
jgi:hypothetical protein